MSTMIADQEYGRIPTVEQIETIIRRMTRVAPRGDLVLADYSERELAIAIRDLMRDTRR
jgi:hypothetical protein